ncbi:polyprenyl synthetase family protein [Streptomyces sp. B1I3]|uniref:polyprenyl synthetase family protein n=1 Tax=Streptomyces sp. B1I3 TaxID=3042264 RepID=UPI00278A03A7|nr:polyprenyl synthetase family protein [Streptomyces sp. B1I3]MDQ0792575.1 geranylgeranyl diphosphate synthase type I [Streptomyces sp. B1I3]
MRSHPTEDPASADLRPGPEGRAHPVPVRADEQDGRTGEQPPHPPPPAEDAAAVDADVAAAVLRTARSVLRERVTRSAAVDPVFARDVAERVAEFTLDGGKRLRPAFLWWGMRACGGGAVTAALRLGVALELIQTCALVHDDVMDGSSLRRGRAAVHVGLAALADTAQGPARAESFGRSAAVLAGDLALAWADDTVADTPMPAECRGRVAGIWQAMRTEMVAGQYLDLHGQITRSRSPEQALRAACLKSALYTVERPLALGAALADAGRDVVRALCTAGRSAGVAFQLRDDLTGVFGDPAGSGKPSGGDIREGKATYLLAVARARAEAAGDREAVRLLDRVVGDAGLAEDALARVREVLTATGARAAVEDEARRLAEQAAHHLDGTAVDPDARRALVALFEGVAAGHHAVRPVPPGQASGPPVPPVPPGQASVPPGQVPARDRPARPHPPAPGRRDPDVPAEGGERRC